MSEKYTTEIVLVVDDSPINLDILTDILTDQYRVETAEDGEQAIKLAEISSPDIILLDITMPDVDGYEVCRRLKRNPKVNKIPVIFVTARGESEDESLGFQVGAVDYIIKPFSPPHRKGADQNTS